MLRPMHELQRMIDAQGRRRERRLKLFRKAAEAAEAEARLEEALGRAAARPPSKRAEAGRLERDRRRADARLFAARKEGQAARRAVSAAIEGRKRRLRSKGKAVAAEWRHESEDSESDFSDAEEHAYERRDMTLVNGKCWVSLEERRLHFEGERWDEVQC